jgi:ribosomal protein S18 acetylase RimI-like enzyme
MIVYRDGKDVQIQALAELRTVCKWKPLPPETLAAQVAGARWAVAAYDASRLVGFARAISDGITNAYVSSVMVHSEYRRRGVGREILKRLIAGREDMRWVLHSRQDAKAFYGALGFEAAQDMMWFGRR